MSGELKLYIKRWCPWCITAQRMLRERQIEFAELDVERDETAYRRMYEISGQRLTPTLEFDGKVLADFGPEDLEQFLEQHGPMTDSY